MIFPARRDGDYADIRVSFKMKKMNDPCETSFPNRGFEVFS